VSLDDVVNQSSCVEHLNSYMFEL